MNRARLEGLLRAVAGGTLSPEGALESLARFPTDDLGFARLDHQRALRQGQAEVVFAAGKSADQLVRICESLERAHGHFLCTRVSEEQLVALTARFPGLGSSLLGRTAWLPAELPVTLDGELLVVTAGTSDLPVAEEAATTAMAMGASVSRLPDVGVAGLHRVLSAGDTLKRADVIIVAAGMEGALPSVVGGLVAVPVIAVPTSVG
ncbi:MAG TPA: nickel pincer cofactor biosynthesis protein LarB, partial [Gemmatimonadales bacterium]|nr:nickel pincer cofactor biosynthesis protein LarB [Gemmatimonadales bacterium]